MQAVATPEQILAEQIRLQLGNVASSAAPAVLLGLLMVFVLRHECSLTLLWLWCAGVITTKLYCTWDARRWLQRGIAPEQAPRLMRWLIFINVLDGMAWAALVWVTMGSASMLNNMIVLAVLTGTIGSAMALLSPVLPVFTGFSIAMLLVFLIRILLPDSDGYGPLGAAGLLYVGSLLAQARGSAQAARNAILLRFENTSLITRLNEESQSARKARYEAEEANLAKSRFLAAASHDLRQPIHAQGLFLELLSKSRLDEQQRMLVEKACATADATASMLNTLLDFSRIEANVIEPQRRPFSLQMLLNQFEIELAEQANQKDLVYRSRETHAIVYSDPDLVALILRNFISNAIRYTEKGGVLVGCRLRGKHMMVEVWDTGIGINPAHHREVFQEFHQLGNPERDSRKGLGLGLAIADGLADILGHPLTLASQPGRGSVFRLSVPLAQAGMPQANESLDALRHEPGSLANRHILLIDDDPIIRTGMHYLLQSWGCHCTMADSLEEARGLLHGNAPDIIISDYRLRDGHTGAQAINRLRQELGTQIPALLITGDTAPERLREALASDLPLLHKPVSPQHLHQKLLAIMPA